MANQSVLELAVGTGKWDSGLKKAKSALDNFTQANGGLQKALDSESQKMQKFVQMMGGMESKAKSAKGMMSDYKSTIEQLTLQYNRMTEAQKKTIGQDYLKTIDQIREKYHSVSEEIQEMNRSLSQTKIPEAGGGLFGGGKMDGMLQVFGGNLMTTAAGAVANLGSELADTVKQGIELAKEGEGIRMAFERLNQPGLIENLKEATHGTVTELELMKNAIKFENFNLPVKDLGTFLAFAQQKAKDTGQSIDYLVSSIVDGLGRQSKQILDNLGISAAELTKRMSEGADMTTAVADIIRDEMSKAGDYVETAADRAARAAARATDKMEEVGRTAMPVAEEWAETWGIIKEGALDLLNTAIGPLARSLASLRKIWAGVDWDKLTDSPFNIDKYPNQGHQTNKPGNDHVRPAKGGYVEVTDTNTGKVIGGRHFDNLDDANSISAWRASLHKTGSGRSSGGRKSNDVTYAADSIAAQEALVSKLTKKWREAGAAVRDDYKKQLDDARQTLSAMQTKQVDASGLQGISGVSIAAMGAQMDIPKELEIKSPLELLNERLKELIDLRDSSMTSEEYQTYDKAVQKQQKEISGFKGEDKLKVTDGIKRATQQLDSITSGINGVTGGLEQLGIDIPEGFNQAIGAIQGISSILSGIVSILTVIEGASLLPFFSSGGIVRAAGGAAVPGKFLSGDQVPALLNSGEVVLNRAQQGNLASQLQDGGMRGGMTARVSGEQIYLAMNNYLRRSGRGELVTWK